MDTVAEREAAERTATMDRHVAFWKRQLSDRILVCFVRDARSGHSSMPTDGDRAVSDQAPAVCDDVAKMPADFERGQSCHLYGRQPGFDEVLDDTVRPAFPWPELQFGHGVMGAAFGGTMHIQSSDEQTYSYNDPVVTDWGQVSNLTFDENDPWVRKCIDCLRYFVHHQTTPFGVRVYFTTEGANFVVAMRGTTQAFYDLIDNPPELRDLYELGYTAGARFFEMRREVVKEHNEQVYGHEAFCDMAPIHGVPIMDTDAYSLCSATVFEGIGFEYKQKMLDRFSGGQIYIHALAYHILPVAGKLDNVTQLTLVTDPACVTPFERRAANRSETYDIPLEMDCELDPFADALAGRTLPGGVKYHVNVSDTSARADELTNLMDRVRSYRAGRLSAKPK